MAPDRATKKSSDGNPANEGSLNANVSTKEKIDRAAISLFSVLGVDGVTTKMIAANAGVSEGVIYRYYQSKEMLAQSLFYGIHEKLADAIKKAGDDFDNIADQTKAIVRAYCTAADTDWEAFTYHLLTTHRFLTALDRQIQPNMNNPVTQTEVLIQKAFDRGELKNGSAKLKAAAALGVVLQTAQHKIYGRVKGDLSNYIDELHDAALAVLHA